MERDVATLKKSLYIELQEAQNAFKEKNYGRCGLCCHYAADLARRIYEQTGQEEKTHVKP